MIIGYAARTGTKRNLLALRERGWRLLVSAAGVHSTEDFDNFGLDNGAWAVHAAWLRAGAAEPRPVLDKRKVIALYTRLGAGADWGVVPDIVAGGNASLEISLRWIPWVLKRCRRALLAVQDGMTVDQIRPYIGPDVGIFVGGGDTFKETTTGAWAELCRERTAWCHVGRVNTQRRLHICTAAHVTSFDGSGVSKYADHVPVMQRALVQQSMLIDRGGKR